MLCRFFLLLFLVVNVSAQIPMGSTKREIINLVGLPSSTSHEGNQETMNYPDFTVVLDNHQMIDLQFKTENHPPLSSYLLHPPKPAPPPAPQNRVATPTPPPARSDPLPAPSAGSAVTPDPVQPAPTDAEASSATGDFLALVKKPVVWVVVFFVGLVLVILRVGALKRRKQEKIVANFPPPPQPKQPGQPVLSVLRRDKPEKPDALKDGWSLELLKNIEWHRFEQVVAAYEKELGSEVELTDFGSDDCIDIRVFGKGTRTLRRVIQCRAIDNEPVSVELVRLFFGAMKREKISQGAFYTPNEFTAAALAMGKTEPKLELIDGETFINLIQRLQPPAQFHLFEVAIEGEYKTPTCPTCGLKMAKQSMGRGSHADSDFWACKNTRCRQTPIKRKQSA